MEIIPSQNAGKVTYAIRNIIAEAKKVEASGKKILYCNIGDPCIFDFQTPRHIIDAVTEAMNRNKNGYAPSPGIEEGREAVAKHLASYNNIKIKPESVFLTAGGSEAIELALTALVSAEENVLTPAPGYPLYNAVITKIGAVLNPYYLNDEWDLDPSEIESRINEKTKAIIIINPNNPTGKMYDEETLRKVIDIALKHKLVIFSDEIYDKLLFEKKHVSIAALTQEVPVITLNGMSKAYLVPGWRVGWMALSNIETDSPYYTTVRRLLDARLCSPGPQQYAIKAALEGPQDHLTEVLGKLKKRRDIVYDRLNRIPGIKCTKPDAAFYAMPEIEDERFSSDEEFVLKLLRETGVLFVNGSGFQTKPGRKFFRVVFLPQEEVLNEAFDKLETFLKK